jgi:A-factor biosynthesis hotdog domain
MSDDETIALFIVGDRFESFAEQTSAVTVARFVAELRAGAYQGDRSRSTLVLAEGQGITPYDWDWIRDELARLGLSERVLIRRNSRGPLSGHSETHKHRESNVLIAGLTRLTDTTFRASLRLHNDQELQIDHQASHVQGMVVLEAARQMYLAVCERHYAYRWPEHRYSYIFDRLEASFRNFLFPLETTIDCEVLEAELTDPEQLVFDSQIKFRQAGLHAATVRIVGMAVDSTVMARKERRGADRAIRYALKRVPSLQSSPPLNEPIDVPIDLEPKGSAR